MHADRPFPSEARTWAALCHLAALVGLLANGVGFILGPLFVWLVKRNEHPFIDEHGKEAVNFQITIFLAIFVLTLTPVIVFLVISPAEVGFGLIPLIVLLGLALFVLDLVLTIVAAIRANSGERYRYPLSIRFIR